MLLQVLVRFILGLIFALGGYFLSQTYLSGFNPKSYPYLLPVVASFGSGLFGVFLIPMIGHYSRLWYSNIVRRIASELLREFQSRVPRMPGRPKFKRENGKNFNPMIVDTSAIIDGRLLDITETGFLAGMLIIPSFVLTELQHISDSANDLKRERGRRGFEILDALKKSSNVKIDILRSDSVEGKDADDKILRLAKNLKAKIITCDFNLNKMATISGVKILNVNELVNAVKSVVLPGETISIRVIQEGKEKNQGVGYLADGTMVVVEKGSSLLGKTGEVTVSRVIQTVAGRMIFATPKED